QRGENERQVDAPSLGFRIKAIDELAEFRLHKGPACADHARRIPGKTSSAVSPAPDCIDQQELDGWNDGEPEQEHAYDREEDVGWRIEQPRAQEADEAGGLDGRGALGNEVLTDE